jgi:hypothetical protein
MHFCSGLPIILVGCKKDLRRDPRVIEELRKTSQRPVTPEEVRLSEFTSGLVPTCPCANTKIHNSGYGSRAKDWRETLLGVLCKIRRGRPRSLPIRHPGCPPNQNVWPEEEVCGIVVDLINHSYHLFIRHPLSSLSFFSFSIPLMCVLIHPRSAYLYTFTRALGLNH